MSTYPNNLYFQQINKSKYPCKSKFKKKTELEQIGIKKRFKFTAVNTPTRIVVRVLELIMRVFTKVKTKIKFYQK